MVDLILTTFDWVPETPRGFVRDLRVRWALEDAGLPYPDGAFRCGRLIAAGGESARRRGPYRPDLVAGRAMRCRGRLWRIARPGRR